MRYGKVENNEVVEVRAVGSRHGKPLIIDGKKITAPWTAEKFEAAGWLLEIVPVVTDLQVVEHGLDNAIISQNSFTYPVRNKTENEQDHDKARALSLEMYHVLKWLKGEGIITTDNIANAPQALRDAYATRKKLGQ